MTLRWVDILHNSFHPTCWHMLDHFKTVMVATKGEKTQGFPVGQLSAARRRGSNFAAFLPHGVNTSYLPTSSRWSPPVVTDLGWQTGSLMASGSLYVADRNSTPREHSYILAGSLGRTSHINEAVWLASCRSKFRPKNLRTPRTRGAASAKKQLPLPSRK